MGVPDVLSSVLDRIEELVIKPRAGYGGVGVVVAPHAETGDVQDIAAELSQDPEAYVAQETIMLSRHPTAAGGRLEPRHVDLGAVRPAGGRHCTRDPGGLARR